MGTSLAAAEGIRSTSPTDGIGYGTGAGGTVTQATSKATGVTLNKACGEITLNAASLASLAIVSFTFTNSAIVLGDNLILNHVGAGTKGGYTLNAECLAGTATVSLRNNTAGALAEALVIRYTLVKAVTA